MRNLLLVVAVLGVASTCSAGVVQLAGGDPGEGFAPLANVFAAKDFYSTGALTVQTVTFDTNADKITIVGGSAGVRWMDMGESADDIALESLLPQSYYLGNGTITTTITGLTPGVSYQFDYLCSAANGGSYTSMRVEYTNSSDTLLLTEPAFRLWPTRAGNPVGFPAVDAAYDVVNTLVAPADGIIKIKSVAEAIPGGWNAYARANALAVTFANPPPAIVPGDANNDRKVDFADYLILESSFGGTPREGEDADYDNNGLVEFADYLVLEANFGRDESVPEPMTLSLLGLAGLAMLRRRGAKA